MKQASKPSNTYQNRDQIRFNEQGIPFSLQFDDIYFDDSNGYQQSQEVFIDGNQLKKQWQKVQQAGHVSAHDRFTIAETGFGTGLNFFLTLLNLEAFFNHQPDSQLYLQFISVEKYPMTAEQIKQSLSSFPNLSHFVDDFVSQYQKIDITEGNEANCSFFSGKVKLTIYFNDATQGFSKLDSNIVDAWFLDGFAPKKNPEMWHAGLYRQMARLSKTHATLATFTVAGMVRRGLKEAGFWVEKNKECAVKDEILTGFYQGDEYQAPKQAFKLKPQIDKPSKVTIVGGGIASACAAYHLVKQGVKVELLCQDMALARQASGNAIGAVYPLLHQVKDKLSCFYADAFNYACDFYQQILEEGYHFSHDFSGVLELSYKQALTNRQYKFEQQSPWKRSLIHSINREQATKLAGMDLGFGGLLMEKAGWVCPPETVNAIIQAAIDTGLCDVKLGVKVDKAEYTDKKRWQLSGTQTKQKQDGSIKEKLFTLNCKILVLAGGSLAKSLSHMSELPLSAVRGQVSQIRENENSSMLKLVVCHKGYLTPANKGVHCIGATFDKDDECTEPRLEDDKSNLTMLQNSMADFSEQVDWQLDDIVRSKANLRCCTPDHMPVVGAMPDIEAHKSLYWKLCKDKNLSYQEQAPSLPGLYVLTGLGARGLCSAPLLGKMLAAELCNLPMPVGHEMAFDLAPNRFVIKELIRNKAIRR